VLALYLYKKISFFEQGKGCGVSDSVLFSRHTGALTCKQAFKNYLSHKGFPSCIE
jgi:hypothetical protein